MNPLLDLLGDAGYVLDTPGAYLRGALSGRLGGRASGEDLLQSWGLDAGPLGGMAAEMVADPLMLAGLAGGAYKGIQGVTRAGRGLSLADDASPLARAMGGFVGDEAAALRPFQQVGRRTDPDFVNAKDWFHGTDAAGLTPLTVDPMRTSADNLAGRGIYKTDDPWIAGEYADNAVGDAVPPDLDAMKELLYRKWVGEHGAAYAARPELDDVRQAFPSAWPDPQVYRANTNIARILDLDAPVDSGVFDSLYGMAEGLHPGFRAANPSATQGPVHWLDQVGRDRNASNMDVIQSVKPSAFSHLAAGVPDPVIVALRRAGYDALTHTGGLRAGGGKTLHDVLISLDPNDTVSRVGRANQITRFDPLDPEQVRQLTGWK